MLFDLSLPCVFIAVTSQKKVIVYKLIKIVSAAIFPAIN